MGLDDIAEGIQVVKSQERRDVAVLDGASESLSEWLSAVAAELPCSTASAAALARSYAGGASIDRASEVADVTPTVAAKTLHLLGFEGIVDVDPADRRAVRRWIDGELDRTTVQRRCTLDEKRFALTVFVETRDPVRGGRGVVESMRTDSDAAADPNRALRETMSDPTDLRAMAPDRTAQEW